MEGVDYSRTADANWPALAAAIKAYGRHFAGRYAVDDVSPYGRGITAAEFDALMNAGVDVFLYWQTTTNWMLGGFTAGVAGAINAQNNIVRAGMPDKMPVYFACDFDASLGQQAAIESCLRGAASIIGADRVGLYGGYWVIDRAMRSGAAAWFCQTSAWSGGAIHEGIHLYQYAYNKYVNGTNCDWVRAYQPQYGQASSYLKPAYPAPILPPFYERVNAHDVPSSFDFEGNRWYPQRTNVKAMKPTYSYRIPSIDSVKTGPAIEAGDRIAVEWAFEDKDGVLWLVNGARGYHRGSQYSPQIILPESRR